MAGEATRDDRLAAMRQKFVARAREQAVRIVELRSQIKFGKGSVDSFQELMRLCHSLHGAAGTFGYDEISVAAGAAEDLCDALTVSAAPPDAAALAELDPAVARVLDLIGKIA